MKHSISQLQKTQTHQMSQTVTELQFTYQVKCDLHAITRHHLSQDAERTFRTIDLVS